MGTGPRSWYGREATLQGTKVPQFVGDLGEMTRQLVSIAASRRGAVNESGSIVPGRDIQSLQLEAI
jgi:hypothetical protein